MRDPLTVPQIESIQAARERIRAFAVHTPLVRLNVDTGENEIYLKLENLQPVCSFKIRGAANAIQLLTPDQLQHGVYTASAGNMAQGVALAALRLGIPCAVIVPQSAPDTKIAAIERLGARIVRVPYLEWWQILVEHRYAGEHGAFIHPVADAGVIAGNATAGVEILEDLPDVDTILVPYGGGGLSCGIASALGALAPHVRVHPCETESAAPLTASIAAGKPIAIEQVPSFIDGIGGKSVLPEMWALARDVLADPVVLSVDAIAAAVRIMAERNRVIAEGAGAAATAAALSGKVRGRKVVCVVSGGNIDTAKLLEILAGNTPLMPGDLQRS